MPSQTTRSDRRAGEETYRSWWGPAAAIVFVGLLIASFSVVPLPPPPGATSEAIRAHFAEHATGVRTYALLQALAALPFLLFVCWLFETLWTSVSQRVAATAVLGSGVLILALSLAGAAVSATLGFGVASDGDANLVRALFDMGNLMLNVGNPLVSVLVGAFALATAPVPWMPRWLTALGLLVAASWLVGSASVVVTTGPFASPTGPYGLGMLLLFIVWIVTVSLVLRARAPHPVA